MSETTKVRQQYGARVAVTDAAMADSAVQIRAIVRQQLERTLQEWGADSLENMQEQPYEYEVEEPRRWWERLLHRPVRTYTIRGIEFVAYGYGWVTNYGPGWIDTSDE